MKIGLIGNPNSGKTTLFNSLTGTNHHVGNWPGKTVEKRSYVMNVGENKAEIVDLPGTYSLTAFSEEEKIPRDFIIDEKPDYIIDIVDATNIQRNLYLTLELLEITKNIIVVINMDNFAKKKGIIIDEKLLSELLRVPVFKINAKDEKEVKHFFQNKLINKKQKKFEINYGKEIEKEVSILSDFFNTKENYPKRWAIIKMFEGDSSILDKIEKKDNFIHQLAESIDRIKRVHGKDYASVISGKRYGIVSGIMHECIQKTKPKRKSRSDIIDRIVTHKWFSMPIFFLIMYFMFQATFTFAGPVINLIEFIIGNILGIIEPLLSGFPEWTSSLITDGIFGGLGSILVFLPNIFILFFIISLLEDSGYLARAAFIMDHYMHKIGLHGKSFIPLILGFGCNVPAIMATRSLDNKKDKILTILINPFMSCSARLPVYILFVGIFFQSYQGLVIFSLYIIGIIMAILTGFLFKRLFFKGQTSELILELPPYRIPPIKGALIHTWERSKEFLYKAGTLIFSFVLLIWFLSSFPLGVEYASKSSLIGIIGRTIAPIFAPLGFGNWQSAVALIFGIAAKEVVVSTFGTLFGAANLTTSLAAIFTPLSAYVFMLVTLIYFPCVATLAVMKKETGSWKWPALSVTYNLIIAWIIGFIVYQIGVLL